MKHLIALCSLAAIAVPSFCQTVTFSSDVIAPQKKKLITGLTFPGVAGNTYYIDEFNIGASMFNREVLDVIHGFDISTLAKTKEVLLNRQVNIISADDYVNMDNIQLQDKLFTFFISSDDKNVYPVYYQKYDADGKLVKEEKTSLQIDNSKIEIWNNKRDHAIKTAASFVVRKNHDGSRILTAVASKSIDKNTSVVTVSMWDEDMKQTFTSDYTIPLAKWMHYNKTAFGKMYDNRFEDGKVLDVADDKNGYIYALVQSGNPANADDENLFWIYQFKQSDKSYMKSFKAEYAGSMMPLNVELRSDEGTVYVAATGYESDKDKKRNLYKVNTCYIGAFNGEGKLEKLLGNRLSMEWLALFNQSDDSRQKKDEYIRELELQHFHVTKDGSMFVVWEQVVKEMTEGAVYMHAYYTSGNALVQYYSSNKKLVWEKPVYKMQVSKDMGPNAFSGIKCFYDNDKLFMLYPDDPKNATKDIADKKVEKFTLVKFGNKDLAGFFALSFNGKGLEKRTYMSWPDDKSGFAISLPSVKHIKNGQFIATARKLSQGAIAFDQKEFTVLKFGL